jgi:hypothetical protein
VQEGYATVLVDQWNGKRWTRRPVAQPDSTARSLASVTCASLARCVAVGRVGDRALVERRSPTGWSNEPSADVDAATAELASVNCLPSGRCIAVGGAGIDAGHQRPLIESAHGTTWSVVHSPATAGDDDTLAGVACASDSACFAVGTTVNGGHPAPLVLSGPG